MDNIIDSHSFCFNPKDNRGEAVILHTGFYDNGDEEVYTMQSLILNSYGRSATIELGSIFTPEILRKLANELESAKIHAESGLPS
jgi:hypothetical protein